MRKGRIAGFLLIMLIALPLVATDDGYEDDGAQFGGLAEAGFAVITAGILWSREHLS